MAKKKQSVWSKDITHEVVSTLAVFALVVASTITMLGVATLGVQAQVAFAQHEGLASQTAAAMLGAQRSSMGDAARPDVRGEQRMATSTLRAAIRTDIKSSIGMYCPKIVAVIARGGKDATTTGSVSELQRFIASHYNLDQKEAVTGYFGSTTAGYLAKFQEEQGIPPSPTVGPLTRAAIARLCGHIPPGDTRETPEASSTRPMPPHPAPVERKPENSTQSYEGSTNAAAVADAVAQISDGYQKLLQASLNLLGL